MIYRDRQTDRSIDKLMNKERGRQKERVCVCEREREGERERERGFRWLCDLG